MFSDAFRGIVNSALPMLIIFIVVICTVRISYIKSTNQKIALHDEIFNLLFIIYDVLGNILIFIPFGYFISRYVRPKKIWPIIVDAMITSITVETVQLKIGRSFDIDDVMLNIMGAILGYFVYVALDAIYKHLPKILQKSFIYDVISLIILVMFILYAANILDLRWF